MNLPERRKDQVSRAEFNELREQCVALGDKIKETADEVKKNTAITEDVHDILASFKVMMHIGKWVSVIATMVVAVLTAIKAGWDFRLK